ncbi:HamA C-terminal domain-containing protein [Gimesia maris]|uniref:HamA C-terminal domain-containing protein n=1 Tax=Gimesia maris TaxID=122 RepID=UPI00241F0ACA|nr:DUF1837 domain-containing protein [Gimesia maris]
MAEVVENDLSPLVEALQDAVRGTANELESCLVKSSDEIQLPNSKAICHCYHVKLDGNSRPMIPALVKILADAVVDYAIPRQQILDAKKRFDNTGSTDSFVRLAQQARSLFNDSSTTGEGGELLLFLFAEKVLGLPQLLSKMILKTSTRHHYHGIDGLHAGTTSSGGLALYWGEAKMKEKRADAIRDALCDLSKFLREEIDLENRDIQLLNQNIDLDNQALESAIIEYFTPTSSKFGEAEYRGIAFIGFDADAYADDSQDVTAELVLEKISIMLPDWQLRVGTRIETESVGTFVLNVLLLPFPSVAEFRLQFLKAIGVRNVD